MAEDGCDPPPPPSAAPPPPPKGPEPKAAVKAAVSEAQAAGESGGEGSSEVGSKSAKAPIDSPATPSISGDAREAIKDGASPKAAVSEAQAAGENAGASKAAAAAGAKNAVSLALIDGTMTNGLVKGNVAYTTPPQEMGWNDTTELDLVLSPSTSESIEELKQKIKEVKEEPGGSSVDVSQRMEAVAFSDPEPAFDVSSMTGESQQPIISEGDTTWRWKAVASNMGEKDLHIRLSIGLSAPQEGEQFIFRPVEGLDPVSFEKISVKGTPWQRASNFGSTNWQWIWTAILVPIVVFLWGRRKRSNKSGDKGFIGNSWQWLRTTIVVPVAAFLQEKHRQSNKN